MRYVRKRCNCKLGCMWFRKDIKCGTPLCYLKKMLLLGCNTDNCVVLITCEQCVEEIKILQAKKLRREWKWRGGKLVKGLLSKVFPNW